LTIQPDHFKLLDRVYMSEVCGYSLPMDLSTFKCPKCDYTHANLNSLRIHWQKLHKLQSIDLRLAVFHDGRRPTCECGCGEETQFNTLQLGFYRFVNGHNARVHNGWGHNPVAQAKSKQTQRGMRERGEIKLNPYKGLTKETDERLALRGTRVATAFTPDKRDKYSVMMTKNRLSGAVPSPRGAQHGMWRGGTSALQPIARSLLHATWTYPKLKASGFTCQGCGSKKDLEVHHDGERFAVILQKAIIALGEVVDDDFAHKSAIAEWVVSYHVKNNVSGIVLCVACHDSKHAA
jgi:hypothetical protein